MPTRPLPRHLQRFLKQQRHAHLATADAGGAPHVVPVVFVLVDGCIYIPIDAKPKSIDPKLISPTSIPRDSLKRLRNLHENPRAAFLVDSYSDDWSQLGFLLIHAEAQVVALRSSPSNIVEALRRKYRQYHNPAMLPIDAPLIKLQPQRYHAWGKLEAD